MSSNDFNYLDRDEMLEELQQRIADLRDGVGDFWEELTRTLRQHAQEQLKQRVDEANGILRDLATWNQLHPADQIPLDADPEVLKLTDDIGAMKREIRHLRQQLDEGGDRFGAPPLAD